jgi:hypothetical protein
MKRQSTNQTVKPTIVSNVKNWKPCENKSVFSFVTTFIDDFGFITRNGVDLQQDYQGARVRRNIIVPHLRGFDFKTNAHFLRFVFFIMRMLRHGQIWRWFRRWLFIHLCSLRLVRCGHTQCHDFKERKTDLQSKSNR